MQYALVDNIKREASPGGRGKCPICQAPMIAKCGNRLLHHWAHYKNENCDPWWENETEWHRKWKELFPIECREVTHVDNTGEIHRADIKSKTNIIIELQHSAISDEERLARENFYNNMIWIIDGRLFKNNFHIYHMLPNPKSELSNSVTWIKTKKHLEGTHAGLFYRGTESKEELSDCKNCKKKLMRIHGFQEIKNDIEKEYSGYHQYDWVRPRKTWLESTKPVYIDFNDDFLYKLISYGNSELKCIRIVSKKKIVHDLMVETDINNLAQSFYIVEDINSDRAESERSSNIEKNSEAKSEKDTMVVKLVTDA